MEDLLKSDSIRCHRPTGTAELYSAVGDAESMLVRWGISSGASWGGLGELPTGSDGLRAALDRPPASTSPPTDPDRTDRCGASREASRYLPGYAVVDNSRRPVSRSRQYRL